MNLLMLSIIMLLVLVLAIYAMTRGAAIEAEIQHMVSTKPVEQVYDEYRDNNLTLNLFVAGGMLLTGAFCLIFFGAGSLDPREWGFTNWIFAIIGLTATIAITLGQRSLYTHVRQNMAALLVTLLILTFVIFSEVATSSEREDSLVRDRSLNSPTLAAVLGKINAADAPPASMAAHYKAEAARYQSLAEQCSGECRRANQAKADGLTARAQAEGERVQTALLQQATTKAALVQSASSLEYVEHNHTAIVRFLKEISQETYTAAMMFASLIFVVAFESGFHFTGTRNGIYIEALSRMGYTVKRNIKRPKLLKDTPTPEPAPPTQTGKNGRNGGVLGTHEEQLPLSPNTGGNRIAERVTRTLDDKNTADPIVRDTDKTDDMAVLYHIAKSAAVGAVLACPTCTATFTKNTYNQCFCGKGCKDSFWNLAKPERLQSARGANIGGGLTA